MADFGLSDNVLADGDCVAAQNVAAVRPTIPLARI